MTPAGVARNAAATRPACVGEPYNWHSDVPAEQETCKAICRGCDVREACLAGAIERDEPAGIWGGESRNLADETIDDWAELPPAHLRVSVYAPEHGSRARYVSGCGCADCTKANTTFVAERRLALSHSPAPVRPVVDLPQLSLFGGITAVTTSAKVTA